MSSQIFDWKDTLSLSSTGAQPQTSKTSESTASLSLAERWTIRQRFADNQILC